MFIAMKSQQKTKILETAVSGVCMPLDYVMDADMTVLNNFLECNSSNVAMV